MEASKDIEARCEEAKAEMRYRLHHGTYQHAKALLKLYKELLEKVKVAKSKEEGIKVIEQAVEQKEADLKEFDAGVEKAKKQLELAKQKRQLAEIEEFAEKHNLEFSEKKDEITNKIFKKGGYCPCKREEKWENICPCRDALKEIVRKGKCTCGLFVLPETTKNKIEPVKHLEAELEDAIILGNIVRDKETEKMLEKGKVTLLDFYAEWCGPCRRLGEALEKINGGNIVVKRIDVEKDSGYSDRVGIKAVPFVAIFDKAGKPFTAFSGARSEEGLRKLLDKCLKKL